MENIISQSNGKVRTVVRLLSGPKERKYLGRYVVEGTRMVREIPDKDLDSIFMTQAYYDKFMGEDVRIRYLVEKAVLRGRCYIVTDIILRKMSDTKHPQGIVATVNTKSYTVEELMQSGETNPLIVVLERIQDPGNMGTMIRTAEAAGYDLIIANEGTVDMYNPKVIRSTMGSIYRMPVIYSQALAADIERLKDAGVQVYAAHLKAKRDYREISYGRRTAVMIGNEGNGLSDEIASKADEYIKIPMKGQVESLNASVAAALLMFAVS